MKRITVSQNLVAESLEGLVTAHPDLLMLGEGHKFVQRRNLRPGKVALISGGGSGHEPLHTGFVGHGMLDAACPGQIFTSPTPDQVVAAAAATDMGAGTLLIVKNYAGDVMNFEMAAELIRGPVRTVLIADDVATAESSGIRRGIAGTLVIEKILGAAAEQGMSLDHLHRLGKALNAQTRSMGVALTSAVMPATGVPTFTLGESEMEMGVGIHGEPGIRRVAMKPAAAIAADLVDAIVGDLAPPPRSECLLLVNGLGGTPDIELYLMARDAMRLLASKGLRPVRLLVGSFVTSLEMAGCSLTVSLLDDTGLACWDAPVRTAALRWGPLT